MYHAYRWLYQVEILPTHLRAKGAVCFIRPSLHILPAHTVTEPEPDHDNLRPHLQRVSIPLFH